MLNDLYRNKMFLLLNFFIPCFKLIDEQHHASHITKKQHPPKTLLGRPGHSGKLKAQQRRNRLALCGGFAPFVVQKSICQKVNAILRCAAKQAECGAIPLLLFSVTSIVRQRDSTLYTACVQERIGKKKAQFRP